MKIGMRNCLMEFAAPPVDLTTMVDHVGRISVLPQEPGQMLSSVCLNPCQVPPSFIPIYSNLAASSASLELSQDLSAFEGTNDQGLTCITFGMHILA